MGTEHLLAGRYRLEEELGAGGMGRVYRGWDEVLGRRVAVKILRSELIESDSASAAVERFRREARLVAGFDHPGIVHVYDMGDDILDGRDVHYLVMQLVDGQTLQELHRTRRLRPVELARIMAEVLSALQHAHERGVVHRDVKPANILITSSGTAKVMDFGIAHLKGAVSMLTATGNVVGTAAYLAPEQARDSRRADARSDLYSVGCVLYQLLTDRLPFPGDTPWEMLLAHQEGTFEPLTRIVPELSGALDPILAKALARNPEDRYRSAEEMRADLVARAATLPDAEPSGVGAAPLPPDMPTVTSRPDTSMPPEPHRAPPRRRSLLAAFGAEAIVGAGYGAVRIFRPDNERRAHVQTPDPGGVRWTATTGTDVILATPAVADNRVVIAGYDGTVYALDAGTGEPIWITATEDRVRPSAVIDAGTVYAASWDRNVYALDLESGDVRWRVPAADENRSFPVALTVADGMVFYGTTNWFVYALDAASGGAAWRTQTYGAASSAPAVVDGVLYLGTAGSVYGLDARTGTVEWRTNMGGEVWSAPAVADGRVYFGNDDNSVYAFDIENGERIWTASTGGPVYSSPAVVDGVVVVGSFDKSVHGFDAVTGEIRWVTPTKEKVYSSPAAADGVVYIGGWDGYLYALEAGSGAVRWRAPTGGQVWSSPEVAGDYVYVGSSAGKLYSIRR